MLLEQLVPVEMEIANDRDIIIISIQAFDNMRDGTGRVIVVDRHSNHF
jgi:hypothetical protein